MSRQIIKCFFCSIESEKETKEIKRQLKKDPNRRFFCSRSCHAKNLNQRSDMKLRLTELHKIYPPPNTTGRRIGKFTRELHMLRHRKKGDGTRVIIEIDEEYLVKLWTEQEGKCAITKIPLKQRTGFYTDPKTPDTVSIDRIDSNLGYIKGNVQIVALSINYAKNDFSSKVFNEFLKAIRTNQ